MQGSASSRKRRCMVSRMRLIAIGLATIALGSCAKRADPGWATANAGVSGDGTVSGVPATVKRAVAAPVLDGKLDDAVWAAQTTLGPFVEPGTGLAPHGSPVEGFARVAWDDRNLYLGFVVRDGSPFSPFGRDENDPHLWEKSSAVEIMLQPGDPADNREYYEVQVDVHGAVFDTRWDDYNVPIAGARDAKTFGHMDWSSALERAVFVREGAFWSAEIALPWASLVKGRTAVPPRSGDVWRLDLYTFRDGQRQALAWSPILGQGNFHKSARFGRIRFE